MYLIRDIMQCKPGKVRDMLAKFRGVSGVMSKAGLKPFRLYTDVSGAPFWTIIADTEVEKLDTFFDLTGKILSDEEARKAMAGYHDLVEGGRREIYKIEG